MRRRRRDPVGAAFDAMIMQNLPDLRRHLFVVVSLLLLTTHRLPAPIKELDTPTPSPAESERTAAAKPHSYPSGKGEQKRREAARPNSAKTEPAAQAAVRFAGAWSGTLHGSYEGKVITIIVADDETRTTIKGAGSIWGDRNGRAARNGNTLSWTFLEETWTMVAEADGKTARLTAHHWPSGSSFGTMSKVR